MNPLRFVRSCSTIGGLGLAVALTTTAPSARANVFASNVKINGGTSNVSVAPGASVSISYILNEPASAGVTIKILSGTTAVRTISLTGGSAGTLRGTSIVVWDGKNGSNTNVPEANYSVSIKAASSGYAAGRRLPMMITRGTTFMKLAASPLIEILTVPITAGYSSGTHSTTAARAPAPTTEITSAFRSSMPMAATPMKAGSPTAG